MGRELRSRGVAISNMIWSASALLDAPGEVRRIHSDYIAAGADVITANTYGIIRADLAREGLEDRFAELNLRACDLAREAVESAGRPVLIAGSLPPLRGSYRPDLVGSLEEIEPLYREQAELLAPRVDLLLCETMSTTAEGRAAAWAATQTGKPVWVSWTLHEDRSGRLRSGETITQAVATLEDLPVTGLLVNCCAPESVARALPQLTRYQGKWIGGYANTFSPVPVDWTLGGHKKTDGVIKLRPDLAPDQYLHHVSRWLKAGASVVGGCCGTRPAHIARIRNTLNTLEHAQ